MRNIKFAMIVTIILGFATAMFGMVISDHRVMVPLGFLILILGLAVIALCVTVEMWREK